MKNKYLFAYGMFRESDKLELGNVINCGISTIPGKIYKVNNFYPGFKQTNDGSLVVGNVYLLESVDIFTKLDEFEGDEYFRKKIIASNDIECWVYEYRYDVKNFNEIVSGDWLIRI